MQKKRMLFLEVISILTLLVFVLGASFAYFGIAINGNNTASMKSKSAKAEGGITFQNKTRKLYFSVNASDMSDLKIGTKYYATDDINKGYALESENHVFPLTEVRVSGGNLKYKCYYNFKVSYGENNSMKTTGHDEIVLSFSGDSTITDGKTIDLYDLNNAGTMNLKGYFYPLVSDDYELDDVAKKGVQLINVELYIKNTNWDQGLSIANKNLEVLIEPEKVDGADTLFQCVEAD